MAEERRLAAILRNAAGAVIATSSLVGAKVRNGFLLDEEGRMVIEGGGADEGEVVGPAGGDLSGEYPDPAIGAEKVTTAKIKNANVTDAKLAKPVIAGGVSAEGALVNGSGFTCAKEATGVYKITLTTELATNGVIALASHSAPVILSPTTESKKIFEVKTFSISVLAENSAFDFMIKAS